MPSSKPTDWKPKSIRGCSSELAAAVASFNAAVTPSHTLCSRRYSLWSLVATHIDHAADNAMERFSLGLNKSSSFSQYAKNNGCIQLMKDIKLLVRRIEGDSQFYADIDTLIEVLFFLKGRSPKENTAVLINVNCKPFCELCWRYTVAFDSYFRGDETPIGNTRYCVEHNPSVPNSSYRNDHRHRNNFEEWLETLGAKKELPPFSDPADQMPIRKKAYAFSHAKLSERRIKILKLYAAGSTQAEIARQLGVSRQAVSKSLFKLRGYFNTWGEISLNSLTK